MQDIYLSNIKNCDFNWSLSNLCKSILEYLDFRNSNGNSHFGLDLQDYNIALERLNIDLVYFANRGLEDQIDETHDIGLNHLVHNFEGMGGEGLCTQVQKLYRPNKFELSIKYSYQTFLSVCGDMEEIKYHPHLGRLDNTWRAIKRYLESRSFDKSIVNHKVLDFFYNHHYPESLFEAIKVFEERIQELLESEDVGTKLVNSAFGSSGSVTIIGLSEKEKDGYKLLCLGLFSNLLRNKYGHKHSQHLSLIEYMHLMSLVNYLYTKLEYVEIKDTTSQHPLTSENTSS